MVVAYRFMYVIVTSYALLFFFFLKSRTNSVGSSHQSEAIIDRFLPAVLHSELGLGSERSTCNMTSSMSTPSTPTITSAGGINSSIRRKRYARNLSEAGKIRIL